MSRPGPDKGYVGCDRLVRLRGGGVGRFRAGGAQALAGVAGGQLVVKVGATGTAITTGAF